MSPLYERPADRWLRAELLAASGREAEALGWYASLSDGVYFFGLPYFGVSLLRRAEIHERLGEPGRAIELYTAFTAAWQGCDAEFRPLLETAEARLAALADRPSGRGP